MTTITLDYPTQNPWSKNEDDAAFSIAREVIAKFDEDVGKRLFADMLKKAEIDADRGHMAFVSAVREGRCTIDKFKDGTSHSRGYKFISEYTRLNTEGLPNVRMAIESQQRWLKQNRYSVDIEKAKLDALHQFIACRSQFFSKIDGKLYEALNGFKVVKGGLLATGVSLRYGSPVEGFIHVRLAADTEFEIRIQLKQNFSAAGKAYWQYPGTFHDVMVKGRTVARPSLYAVSRAMAKAFGVTLRKSQEAPQEVEATKQNLKSLVNLIYLLVNEESLEKTAASRRNRGFRIDTQGPRVQIHRNAKKLGLPNDVTEETVRAVLEASLPQEAKDRLKIMINIGCVDLGKRGSSEAATDKLLKYMELAEMGSHGEWPDETGVTITTRMYRRLFTAERQ